MNRNAKVLTLLVLASVSALMLSGSFGGIASNPLESSPFNFQPPSIVPPDEVDIDNSGAGDSDLDAVLFKVYKADSGTAYLRVAVNVDYLGDGKWARYDDSQWRTYGTLGPLQSTATHEMKIEPVAPMNGVMPIPKAAHNVSAGVGQELFYREWSETLVHRAKFHRNMSSNTLCREMT